MTWAIAERGRAVGGVEYMRATEQLAAFTRRVAEWWTGGFDLLLTPTLVEPPPLLGEFAGTAEEPLRGFARAGDFVVFTLPFNATGQPAVSLPLSWNADGLPIGVQLVGRDCAEATLIRIAAQIEKARPWIERKPKVMG